MLKGLKRLAGGGLLLLELRGIRREVEALRTVLIRVADALETYNAHQWPQQASTSPAEDLPATEITFVDDARQARLAEIEMALTGAKGLPPNADQVLDEYERLYGDQSA